MSSVIKAEQIALIAGPPSLEAGDSAALRGPETAAVLARLLLNTTPVQVVARERAARVVERARDEARSMLEDAATERDAVLDEARREGYSTGMTEGRKAGAAAVQAEADERMDALRALVDALAEARADVAARYETDIVELALAVAARIVRRETALGVETVREVLREALPRTSGTKEITITLHPDDMAALTPDVESLMSLTDERANVSWVTDDRVARGGCLVETERGGIDGTVVTRVSRIVESLMDVIHSGS